MIRQLIAQDKILEAIQLIPDEHLQVILSARFNALKRDDRSGTLSFEQYSVEKARIVKAILESAGLSSETSFNKSNTNVTKTPSNATDLRTLVENELTKNRRNDSIYNLLSGLLLKVNTYLENKLVSPTYDPFKRSYKYLEEEFQKIMNTSSHIKEESVTEFIDRVLLLLIESAPSWDNLSEAYKLCQTKGFRDSFIEINLSNRLEISEVKVEIATKIETFLTSLAQV